MRLVYIYAYKSIEKQPQFQFQFRRSRKNKEGKLKQGKLTSRFRLNENFKGTETTNEKFSGFAVPCFAGIICRVHFRINNIGREGRQDPRRYQICLFVFEEIFSRTRNICPTSQSAIGAGEILPTIED